MNRIVNYLFACIGGFALGYAIWQTMGAIIGVLLAIAAHHFEQRAVREIKQKVEYPESNNTENSNHESRKPSSHLRN